MRPRGLIAVGVISMHAHVIHRRTGGDMLAEAKRQEDAVDNVLRLLVADPDQHPQLQRIQ